MRFAAGQWYVHNTMVPWTKTGAEKEIKGCADGSYLGLRRRFLFRADADGSWLGLRRKQLKFRARPPGFQHKVQRL